MKSLNTLIKLEKRKIDELRRSLTALEAKRQRLIEAANLLVQELHKEMELAQKTPEMAAFFGDFAGRIRRAREAVAIDIGKVEQEIGKLSEIISGHYTELKKFELIKEARLQKQREARARAETNELDEIAGQGFMRKKH